MNEATATEVATQSAEVNELFDALAAAQGELTDPEKTREAKLSGKAKSSGKEYEYSYKYADIADVLSGIRPIFSKHGLHITQPTKIVGQNIILVTRIGHKSGQWISSEYPVCSLNGDHKAMGSAMTYARRYALTSLAAVAASEDIDGDGAARSGEGPTKPMNANEAKSELDWETIQASIDNCPTFEKLNAMRARIEQRKDWPSSYKSTAKERCDLRETVLAWRDENTALFDRLDTCESFDDVAKVEQAAQSILDGQDPLFGAEVATAAERRRNSISLNAGKLV